MTKMDEGRVTVAEAGHLPNEPREADSDSGISSAVVVANEGTADDPPWDASRPRRLRRHHQMPPMPVPPPTGYRPRTDRSCRPKRRCGDLSPRPRRGRDTRQWPPGPSSQVLYLALVVPGRAGKSACHTRFSHLFACRHTTGLSGEELTGKFNYPAWNASGVAVSNERVDVGSSEQTLLKINLNVN